MIFARIPSQTHDNPPMSTPKRSSGASAQAALSSALAAHGSARVEGLVRLSREHPEFAPVWVALAEEHLDARRKEEALTAARRALKLDIDAHRQFSPALREISSSLIPERKREPVPAPPAASKARPSASHLGRPAASEPAAQALQQASILVGYHRRTRLEELSQEYPDYAPIWVALAEETLAQRSVAQAMEAAERAMAMDPSLEAVMSPPLARAWKYHRKESRAAAPKARAGSTDPERPASSTTSAAPYGTHGATRPEPSLEPAAPAEAPRPTKPGLQKMLATALGLRSRPERITVLEQLRAMDPDSDEVLFHLAKELALDNRMDDARKAGDQLRELSPERYSELYAWASAHWASKATAGPPSAPTAAPAEREAPAPPAARVRSPEPPSSPQPPRVNIAPPPAMDEDVEPTIKVSRPPDPLPTATLDHGKENAEFKTVVMKLSDMQRLTDETRVAPGPGSGQAGSPGAPDDTPIESTRPAPATPPVHARIRQAPPDTYVDVRPRGRVRVGDAAPDTELQFKPPERKPGDSNTARMDVGDILGDGHSSTMPPWLSNPRPWATPGAPSTEAAPRANPVERAPSPRVVSVPAPGAAERRLPSAAEPLEPEPSHASAPRPQTPAPRAHPRLVPNRKRPPKPSDEG